MATTRNSELSPLKRLIQKEVINQLSKRILAGDLDKTKPVLVDVFDGTVVLEMRFLPVSRPDKETNP